MVTTFADAQVDIDTVYRGFEGDTTPIAVRFTNNNTLDQNFQGVGQRNANFSDRLPYYCQVAVHRESTAAGTVTLNMGGVSASVVVTTIPDDTWQVLRISQNSDAWYSNFKEDDMDLTIVYTGYTVGAVLLDDVLVVPYTFIDSLWYVVVGAETPFLFDDVFTWTDANEGSRGKIAYWLLYRSGWGQISLPSTTGGTETIADP